MKIRPVEADLFHADGRTDIKKLTVAARNFANSPKNLTKTQMHFVSKMPNFYLNPTVHTVISRL
jgi:hypothetical protein